MVYVWILQDCEETVDNVRVFSSAQAAMNARDEDFGEEGDWVEVYPNHWERNGRDMYPLYRLKIEGA